MPTYDYRCEANGQVYEAKHGMNESIRTWAELCELTGQALADIAPDSPVTKLATGGQVVSSSSLREKAPACGAGACNACQFN